MKFEPEHRGIWITLVRSHVILGFAGLFTGLLAGLIAIEATAAGAASPGFTLLFTGVIGALFGMIAAGLITLRPDHGYIIARLREALSRRRWAVVVRPLGETPARVACAMLRGMGARPLRSF